MHPDPSQLVDQPLRHLLQTDVQQCAAGLIGCVLARRLPDGSVLRARVVEAEAYHMRERGCHAHTGMTPRNEVMFGPAGRLYVYFTYGMWHCCNVVCEAEGTAAAVLLRAAESLPPHDAITLGKEAPRLSGPGLLCQGLSLTREHNGANLFDRAGPVWLYRPADYSPPPLSWTTRIGFSFPDTLDWRCFWTGHPSVSPARTGVLKRKGRS